MLSKYNPLDQWKRFSHCGSTLRVQCQQFRCVPFPYSLQFSTCYRETIYSMGDLLATKKGKQGRTMRTVWRTYRSALPVPAPWPPAWRLRWCCLSIQVTSSPQPPPQLHHTRPRRRRCGPRPHPHRLSRFIRLIPKTSRWHSLSIAAAAAVLPPLRPYPLGGGGAARSGAVSGECHCPILT